MTTTSGCRNSSRTLDSSKGFLSTFAPRRTLFIVWYHSEHGLMRVEYRVKFNILWVPISAQKHASPSFPPSSINSWP